MTDHLPVEASIDLDQFMGSWYVQAHIPPPFTGNAYNAVETYTLTSETNIDVHYSYNKGSLDGPKKTMEPKGFVLPHSGNAIWEMQFLWPFKSDYRISFVDEKYTCTIVARQKRDYVWIMTREAHIEVDWMNTLKQRTAALGYDLSKLEVIPHQ